MARINDLWDRFLDKRVVWSLVVVQDGYRAQPIARCIQIHITNNNINVNNAFCRCEGDLKIEHYSGEDNLLNLYYEYQTMIKEKELESKNNQNP